ncbi:protein of unknown function [Granulicatella balaenopterae]|uniref:DUF4428 domain-containing protein n=1 Tax=Granulicatella balaenopterae TaxID=137733 RepID=A0A1H9IRW6_9LACT|nr:DUF4428 domain-containing protein [Granulicatella balaenopterae]SEQ77259.1 protein of unknown function [Granulicatella balaenopterae]
MGFFDKKTCDICGEKIGMLGNRKLDDGNLCKSCAKKLSPWFEERRHSTVDAIRQQLAYREENMQKVADFTITTDIPTDNGYHVYIDQRHGWFSVSRAMNKETNPDIVDLSSVVNCLLDIDEDRREEKYRDNDGDWVSYNPPRFSYRYDYWIKMTVNHPWFDDMDFQINSFEVEGEDRQQMMQMENTARQITMALTSGNTLTGMGNHGFPGNMRMPIHGGMNQPSYLQQGGIPHPYSDMNQPSYPQQGGMNQGYSGTNQQGGMNHVYRDFNQPACLSQCDMSPGYEVINHQNANPNAVRIHCDKCGWMAPNEETQPKFCPMCGDTIDWNDLI